MSYSVRIGDLLLEIYIRWKIDLWTKQTNNDLLLANLSIIIILYRAYIWSTTYRRLLTSWLLIDAVSGCKFVLRYKIWCPQV